MISDNSKKLPALKGLLNFIISVGLAVLFLYFAFYNVDFGEVMSIVSQASIFWMIVFIITVMLGHYIRTLRWKVILHSVKPDAKMKNLFGALMIGYGVNCVTPKLGEVTRAVMLGKWENLSRSSMFGTVIVERVIDILTLGISVLISALIWSGNLYVSFPWLRDTIYISILLMLAAIVVIYLTVKFREKFYGGIVKIFEKISHRFAEKLAYIFDMLIEGFASLKGLRNYLLTFLLTVVLMLAYGFTSYVGFFMLGMNETQNVTYAMGWILMTISAIGVVIPTPGATGSYHALAKSTLVLIFGFTETISVAYAFLTHIISLFIFIFTALIMFLLLNKQHINIFKLIKKDLEET